MVAAAGVLYLINIIVSVVEGFIGLRILLKLLGASTNAPFTRWVYETSQPLLAPFEGMFPTTRLSGGFVLEISALFALIVYAFIGFILIEAVQYLEYQARRYRK